MSGFSKERNTDISEKVIYEILLRTFTEEGSIKAATSKLKHIAALGVDIIYLAPFFEMDDDEDRSAWSARQIASDMNNPKNPYRIRIDAPASVSRNTSSEIITVSNESKTGGLSSCKSRL